MRVLRKKFTRPRRPWDTARMEEETKVMKEFGLRRKHEIWRAQETVRKLRRRARTLIAVKDRKQTDALLHKLVQMGLLEKGQGLDNVLALTMNDLLKRRLQTVVHKKGYSKTIMQSRQMIVHGHVVVGDRKVRYPSAQITPEMEPHVKVRGS